MKVKCPECQRIVGTKKDNGVTQISKHRTGRGSKNKVKETRYPYCKRSGELVTA